MNLVSDFLPNVVKYFDMLVKSTRDTLIMVGISEVIAIILGVILGTILVVTS
jgi:ABC-type methionine transport system permease subunit